MSGWTILFRLIHSRALHIGWKDGDFQSDIFILLFKNGEHLEYLHGIILILQQEIILYIEAISPTRLIFQDMKEFSKSD